MLTQQKSHDRPRTSQSFKSCNTLVAGKLDRTQCFRRECLQKGDHIQTPVWPAKAVVRLKSEYARGPYLVLSNPLTEAQCEGSRPSCSRCSERSLTCVYETNRISRRDEFRTRDRVHGRLIGDLRSSLNSLRVLADGDALQVLRAITESEDPLATLASVQNMHRLPPALPVQAINGAAVPDGILPFQYELMMQHPNAFPAVAPLVHVAGDLSALESSNQRMITANPSESDPRLAGVKISRWTTVQIRDTDARRLIGNYLDTDHPVIGLFDADLFLEDLSTYSHAFCSEFLVNCILFWSCVCRPKSRAVCVRQADVCTAVMQL